MSVSELKNLAKEQGLDITKCVEKKEIVNMIVSPEEVFSNYREYRMEALEKLKKEKMLLKMVAMMGWKNIHISQEKY